MNTNTFDKLQFDKIIETVQSYCTSSLGQSLAQNLHPYKQYAQVMQKLAETSEARAILDAFGNFTLSGTENIAEIISYVEKDGILNVGQAVQSLAFLHGVRKVKSFMQNKDYYASTLCLLAEGIVDPQPIIAEFEEMIQNNQIADNATNELRTIRRHIALTEDKIKDKLESFLRSKANEKHIQEFFISKRNGRQTIPVKITSKNLVAGTVIDSNKKTAFIEPDTVRKLTDELMVLESEQAQEEYRILCILTDILYTNLFDIQHNLHSLAALDFAFAKGRYSRAINGIAPQLNDHGVIQIVNGKHPLLEGDVVPLNVEIGKDFRTLIITGPNAGGKTVAMKTIGLLTLAVQAGLHIPCHPNSNLSIFEQIFVDIGDDQSMENALSTFSSHVKNLALCVNKANKSTLLLFDEIGSGTEPGEGSALAIAILEDVYQKGAITVASTHMNEIKNYSSLHPDYENAAMKFEKETLKPLYQLQLKKAGNSHALWISKQMGIQEKILQKAERYQASKDYDFSPVPSAKVRTPSAVSETKVYPSYAIGDRVYVQTLQQSGVVHKPKDEHDQVEVFFEGEFKTLHVRLLKLEVSAENLYPVGYDMDQVFRSWKERKLEHDLERGSKKTIKKIKKYGIDELLKE